MEAALVLWVVYDGSIKPATLEFLKLHAESVLLDEGTPSKAILRKKSAFQQKISVAPPQVSEIVVENLARRVWPNGSAAYRTDWKSTENITHTHKQLQQGKLALIRLSLGSTNQQMEGG